MSESRMRENLTYGLMRRGRINFLLTKEICYYSFATKYCSRHQPERFAIYDSFVEKVLVWFSDEYGFAEFKNEDLRNYPNFKRVLMAFIEHFKLQKYSLKQIDQYLWLLGKEKFPSNYSK